MIDSNPNILRDMSQMLIKLREQEGWENIEVAEVDGLWRCRDHTDEGIGGNLNFDGKTPLEAVRKAYKKVVLK
jgi:hypothetical protein